MQKQATHQYKKYYRRKNARRKPPKNPLLYVPSHPARTFDRILEKTDIPKETPKGKVDFHACRVAFTTLLDKHGASVKEMQELARHTDPRITMNTYTKVADERLHELIEDVGSELSKVDNNNTQSSKVPILKVVSRETVEQPDE